MFSAAGIGLDEAVGGDRDGENVFPEPDAKTYHGVVVMTMICDTTGR